MTISSATLTLRDVADVARVQRPVVSMWRKRVRVRGAELPFPEPVKIEGGVEHFAAGEVTAWLVQTGRGNNAEVSLDIPSAAIADELDIDQVEALLVLAHVSQVAVSHLQTEDLLNLADEADPDDRMLQTEVASVTEKDREVIAKFADTLLAASYSPADALDRLADGRLGRASRTDVLTRAGVDLVVRLFSEVVVHLDRGPLHVVDGRNGDDGVAGLVARRAGDATCSGVILTGERAGARRARRHALLRDLDAPDSASADGVHLLTMMGLTDAEAMRRADDLQLALSPDQVGLVIGPARLLCDRLEDRDLDGLRAQVLRGGTLRLVARLPQGLCPSAVRQHLAVWVFGAPSGERADERILAIADLGERDLDEVVSSLLASDVIAALSNSRVHAFGFARLLPLSRVLTSPVLVPRGIAPATEAKSDMDRVLPLTRSVELLRDSPPLDDGLAFEPTGRSSSPRRVSIAALLRDGDVKLLRGARLDPAGADSSGKVRIVDPTDGVRDVGFDPLDLAGRTTPEIRTRPGDVVFTVTPAPAAVVDHRGGSVVLAPARIFRIGDTADVTPEVLARTIGSHPPGAREWRGWTVPTVPLGERGPLERRLRRLRQEADAAERRATVARQLADDLIEAVAADAVTLTPEGT